MQGHCLDLDHGPGYAPGRGAASAPAGRAQVRPDMGCVGCRGVHARRSTGRVGVVFTRRGPRRPIEGGSRRAWPGSRERDRRPRPMPDALRTSRAPLDRSCPAWALHQSMQERVAGRPMSSLRPGSCAGAGTAAVVRAGVNVREWVRWLVWTLGAEPGCGPGCKSLHSAQSGTRASNMPERQCIDRTAPPVRAIVIRDIKNTVLRRLAQPPDDHEGSPAAAHPWPPSGLAPDSPRQCLPPRLARGERARGHVHVASAIRAPARAGRRCGARGHPALEGSTAQALRSAIPAGSGSRVPRRCWRGRAIHCGAGSGRTGGSPRGAARHSRARSPGERRARQAATRRRRPGV
jgi:hypothetical protein